MASVAGNMAGNVLDSVTSIISTVGRSALHALAPNNFEYYMCSFELLDSAGNTLGFMYFPVMPSSISESKTPIESITKTNRGISSMFNDSFNPVDITLQGTFGRKLRLLLGMTEVEDVSSNSFFGGNNTSFLNGNYYVRTGTGVRSEHIKSTNVLVKSGYGMMKMMKRMLDASFELDDKGNPCILLFNNYAFNTHYVVEVLPYTFSQNRDSNMLWYYSLQLKAVAPASAVKQIDAKQFLTTVASGAVAKSLNKLITDISRLNPISLPL